MCGRFTLTAPPEQIADAFALDGAPLEMAARFNVAPSQDVATVDLDREHAVRRLAWRRWGLIPHWAKDERIGHRQINARIETLADKPAFREAFRRRRCIVAADGFYEWVGPSGARQPHHIRFADGAVFGFAGLFERWRGGEGVVVESCTVITTEANALLRELHDRMPVILDRSDYTRWLDPETSDPEKLQPLLRSAPSDDLTFAPVGPRVNDVRFDDPGCLSQSGIQPNLFG